MKEILITGCRGQLGNEIQLLASEYPHFHFFLQTEKSWILRTRSR